MNTERFSQSKPVLAYDGTTVSSDGTVNGESIDTLGYRSLTIPLDIVRTTDGQIDSITFEESSDDGASDAYTEVEAESLYYPDEYPITADAQVVVGCVAKERYVRLRIVFSGFTSGNIAIPKTLGLLQDAESQPPRKESSVLSDSDVNSPDATADATTTFPKR